MPRLIDADDLLMDNSWAFYDENGNRNDACIAVENAPTVDAELVVQCRDCKQFVETNALYDGECPKLRVYVNKDYYCWWGERREDAEKTD